MWTAVRRMLKPGVYEKIYSLACFACFQEFCVDNFCFPFHVTFFSFFLSFFTFPLFFKWNSVPKQALKCFELWLNRNFTCVRPSHSSLASCWTKNWIQTALLLAFNSVNNDGPSYLSDLLKFYIPSRQLRSSSDARLLCIPSFRLKFFGQRKFSYQATVLWNFLPISLRHSNSTLAFKSALKTHLFPSQ